MMLVLVFRLWAYEEHAQLVSEFRSMKRAWETLTLRDKRYDYFAQKQAKR